MPPKTKKLAKELALNPELAEQVKLKLAAERAQPSVPPTSIYIPVSMSIRLDGRPCPKLRVINSSCGRHAVFMKVHAGQYPGKAEDLFADLHAISQLALVCVSSAGSRTMQLTESSDAS